uniref:SUN domain-containing protein n=1 Tax=Timema bartmani TaxID=61472 RepID=A0A7R9FA37_9NEOP|nr:unnamed protein product [Timema bartmani]
MGDETPRTVRSLRSGSSRHSSSSRVSRTNPKHDENVNRHSHGGTAASTNTSMSSRTDLPSMEPQGICLCEYMSTSQEPMIMALEMSGSEEESLELSPPDTHVLLDGVIRALEARHKALQMELRGWKEHSLALKKTVDNLQVSLEEFKNSIADIQDEKIPDNEEMVKKLIQEELSLYDADKTGLPDYALESVDNFMPSPVSPLDSMLLKYFIPMALTLVSLVSSAQVSAAYVTIGTSGAIVSTPDTMTYKSEEWHHFWGLILWREMDYYPRYVIQPSMQPGHCWAFYGTTGKVVIRLAKDIFVTAVTLEHIPASIAPAGNISSAPNSFAVIGFVPEEYEKDNKEILLGTFSYNNSGPSRQTFKVNLKDSSYIGPFRQVGLWILTNYGNPKYTCVYRFRVHGNITHSASANRDGHQEYISTEVGT